MRIRTPLDFGLVIRERRRRLKLTQTELAQKAGVGRQWLVAVERGKPRAEVGMVLRTFSVLGLSLMFRADDRSPRSSDDTSPIDIGAIVDAHKGGRE